MPYIVDLTAAPGLSARNTALFWAQIPQTAHTEIVIANILFLAAIKDMLFSGISIY